jgi:glycosyltransferase involved in cell wall biosynthesis
MPTPQPDRPHPPTICVLIPLHNQAEYLFRALSSVVWQIGSQDEIIVVDDASTDLPAGPAALPFRDRVLWLRNPERRGVSYSRNLGIRRSRADWIKFLDADDMLAPFALDLVRRAHPPVSEAIQVVAGGCHRIVDHRYHDYLCGDDGSLRRILEVNPLLPSAVFVRRGALLEVGLFDERIDFEEDWDLWLRLHDRFGLAAFATTTAPVCYYWINHKERQQKRREAKVDEIPVREYFRRRYGAVVPD